MMSFCDRIVVSGDDVGVTTDDDGGRRGDDQMEMMTMVVVVGDDADRDDGGDSEDQSVSWPGATTWLLCPACQCVE